MAKINSISEEQNRDSCLRKLASQRFLYSFAKKLLSLQLIIDVPFLITISIIVAFLKSDTIMKNLNMQIYDGSWIIAILGIGIFFFDALAFDNIINLKKELAAKIQEEFDCEVLNISWNDISVGSHPRKEDIVKYSNMYLKKKNFSALNNWYPKIVETIPIHAARIICQKSNLWWDSEIRSSFTRVIVIITVMMFLILLIIGMTSKLTVTNFLYSVIAPFMPIFGFCIKQVMANKKAITRINHLNNKAEDIWNELIHDRSSHPDKYFCISRTLQDGIFMCRRDNPLIFDFFYELMRNKQERIMTSSAEEMVLIYKKKLSEI